MYILHTAPVCLYIKRVCCMRCTSGAPFERVHVVVVEAVDRRKTWEGSCSVAAAVLCAHKAFTVAIMWWLRLRVGCVVYTDVR